MAIPDRPALAREPRGAAASWSRCWPGWSGRKARCRAAWLLG